MCGIIGLISNEDVKLQILNGLEQLLYRGYDSTGICTLNCDSLVLSLISIWFS